MATIDTPSRRGAPATPTTGGRTASTPSTATPLAQDPARQAYLILRSAFVIAPVVFGLDKFTNWLVQWDQYLAPALSDPLPMTPHQAMYVVGVVEVVAGVVVALHARLGALVVAAWLTGIIVNLLLIPGYYDVALRDFGLLLSALALQRLAGRYDPRPLTWPLHRRSA
ncbi:MAG TPA: DoxX family membrane protein [Ornithinibacter sp.]|nr:DoxX family membrane protein [Ornithinibacter sp.]